jgi:hypothetical protein
MRVTHDESTRGTGFANVLGITINKAPHQVTGTAISPRFLNVFQCSRARALTLTAPNEPAFGFLHIALKCGVPCDLHCWGFANRTALPVAGLERCRFVRPFDPCLKAFSRASWEEDLDCARVFRKPPKLPGRGRQPTIALF